MSSSKIEKILQKDFEEVEVRQEKKICSIKNFCKYLKPKIIKDKNFYINKWRYYLTQESQSKSKMNDPFLILTNMWAHKPVIHELEKVRINPNLIKKAKKKRMNDIIIRNDLEFYIPQICSFILFGDNELIDELLAFLCKSCYCSYFFAHRVIWFLKSMLTSDMNINNSMNKKILDIIHIIQTIYKSDSEENKKILNNYCIAGGKVYADFIEKYYSSKNENVETEKNKVNIEKTNLNNAMKINIYTKYGYCTNSEDVISDGGINSIKQIDESDINLTAFLSNINFFDHLTKICERIRFLTTPETRQSELFKEIIKINEYLPCNIYIPFSNKEMRNYIIGHISIKDTKVFKTKERAPIILTFECFRLEEYCYDQKMKIKSHNSNIIDNKENMKNSLLSNFKNTIQNKIIDKNVKSHFDKVNYLMGVDISLSKPIFVRKSSDSLGIITSNKEDNKITEENKINNEGDKFEKIEEAVLQKRKSSKDLMTKIKEKANFNLKKLDINLTKLNNSSSKDINKYATPSPDKSKNTNFGFFEINSDFFESSSSSGEDASNNSISNIIAKQISPTGLFSFKFDKKNTNNNSPSFNISKNLHTSNNYAMVFGETMIQQESRLRFQSQFGYLSSYKICKVLIKTGEDFRQEQFASQLINEFAQIFKIEEVDCFLYPYEIISTGNNCGIIEVCPNSMSLDELKHKTSFNPDNSLKVFYEYYFIKGSKKYYKALRNLVRSLAGYSLVCYFLQIKDRHNGNILINNEGYLIQIDFGFFLSNAPGNEFEKAPFKLTEEVIEVIGGVKSKYFQYFRKLMWKGILAISKHYEKIMILVEMMYCGYGKELECFKQGDATLTKLRQRFKPKADMKKRDYLALVDNLIHQALSSWTTKWYDKYQYFFEGIFY